MSSKPALQDSTTSWDGIPQGNVILGEGAIGTGKTTMGG
jgi:KaiC/GvpD/RAD55 family RecA-like ATPase